MEKRKSQRSFDLQKGSQRSFDLDKKPTRTFELTKEQVTPAEPVSLSETDTKVLVKDNPQKKNNSKALRNGIIFLLVLVVAICCWLFIPKGGNETEPVPDEPIPVVNDESSNPNVDAEPEMTIDPEISAEPEITAEAEPVATPQPSTQPVVAPNPATQPTVSPVTAPVSNDVEAEARKVINGVYGNNPERRQLLGDKYEAIQTRVNEMKRQGLF